MIQTNLLTKQKETHLENEAWLLRERLLREFGMNMYTLLCLKWITNKDSLYKTWYSALWYAALDRKGGLGESGWIHVCYGWVSVLFIWNYHNIVSQLLLFSHSVMSDSLRPHGLLHTRLPCPTLSPRACSNSCSSGWWYHPTISSSVAPSPSAFSLSHHESVLPSHQVAKVLELQIQHHSFQRIYRTDFF